MWNPEAPRDPMTAQWRVQTSGPMDSRISDKLSSSTSQPKFFPPPSRLLFTHPSHAAVGVGRFLFPIFALALDLPEDFFGDKVRY